MADVLLAACRGLWLKAAFIGALRRPAAFCAKTNEGINTKHLSHRGSGLAPLSCPPVRIHQQRRRHSCRPPRPEPGDINHSSAAVTAVCVLSCGVCCC